MKILEIPKLIFNLDDLAKYLEINRESAKVTASRLVKRNILLRLKKDSYVLKNRFKKLSEEEYFRISNLLQTPSYISLTTALSYYNITTQRQRNYFESISLKRSKKLEIEDAEFLFIKIKKELYNSFELRDGFFIAMPEKALADAVYLNSFGKYILDFDAVDFSKLDLKMISKLLKETSSKTINFWKGICKTYRI